LHKNERQATKTAGELTTAKAMRNEKRCCLDQAKYCRLNDKKAKCFYRSNNKAGFDDVETTSNRCAGAHLLLMKIMQLLLSERHGLSLLHQHLLLQLTRSGNDRWCISGTFKAT